MTLTVVQRTWNQKSGDQKTGDGSLKFVAAIANPETNKDSETKKEPETKKDPEPPKEPKSEVKPVEGSGPAPAPSTELPDSKPQDVGDVNPKRPEAPPKDADTVVSLPPMIGTTPSPAPVAESTTSATPELPPVAPVETTSLPSPPPAAATAPVAESAKLPTPEPTPVPLPVVAADPKASLPEINPAAANPTATLPPTGTPVAAEPPAPTTPPPALTTPSPAPTTPPPAPTTPSPALTTPPAMTSEPPPVAHETQPNPTAPVPSANPPALESVPPAPPNPPAASAATLAPAPGRVGSDDHFFDRRWDRDCRTLLDRGPGCRLGGGRERRPTDSRDRAHRLDPVDNELSQPSPTRVADGPRPSDDLAADQIEPVFHKVKPGENFWTISKLFYNSGRYYKALHAANQKQVPEITKLYVGTVLTIPPPEKLDRNLIERETAPVTRTTKKADPTDLADLASPPRRRIARTDPEVAEPVRRPTYKVKPRDTLRKIARDTLNDSSRDKEIFDLNRDQLDDPKELPAGTILVLPEDANVNRGSR